MRRAGPTAELHRGRKVVSFNVDRLDPLVINKIEVYVARLKDEPGYYIISAHAGDDDNMADIGPFDNAAAACTAAKLMGST